MISSGTMVSAQKITHHGNIVIVLTVDVGDMITTFVKMDM
jgi:hypothetical protein